MGAFRQKLAPMIDGQLRVEKRPTIGEAIRRDIDYAHDAGAGSHVLIVNHGLSRKVGHHEKGQRLIALPLSLVATMLIKSATP